MTITKLMGILNVTPDSFFDKGQFFKCEAAIDKGLLIEKEGADILDIGGESTRPGSIPVSEAEELRRVIPVIKVLHEKLKIPISIDTQKPYIAAAAIEAGASFINDISGCFDREMRELVASSSVEICVMHMQGTPATMQNNPQYPNGIINDLLHWFEERINLLLNSGIKESQIILDPGIGFGKSVADNLEIIQNLSLLKAIGFPILLGVSRKSFIHKILNHSVNKVVDLLPATIAINAIAIAANVDIIRVHDIAAHRSVIDLFKEFGSALHARSDA